MAEVIIGVDPHKRSATIEIINAREKTVGQGRFGTDRDGYQAMLAAGRKHRDVVGKTRRWMTLTGIGPSGAARLLGDVGDIARFTSRAHFASWNGTAPIDASSGEQNRHRLSRAGNRRCPSRPGV